MNKHRKLKMALSITLMEITIVIVCLLFLGPAYNDIINADYNVLGGVLGGGTTYNKEVTLTRDYKGHLAGTRFTAYRISFDRRIISSNLGSHREINLIPFDYVEEKEDMIATANAMQTRMDEYISSRKTYMISVSAGFLLLGIAAPFISVSIRKYRIKKMQQKE